MRIQKLYFLIAAVALVSGNACQTAQRPAALVPSVNSSPPPLNANSTAQANTQAKAVPAPQTQTEAKPDPVAELIAQVEKEYKLGEENYKAGHLEAAKENFDRGFNLLLSSSLDVRTDERLQQEFDRILDGVNGLELQALQEGDGFAQQKSEPAPIDEANEVTYPVDPNLKLKPRPKSRLHIPTCL